MSASAGHAGLLAAAKRLLDSLAAPALAPFLADWPQLPGAESIDLERRAPMRSPAALPALRWLRQISVQAPGFCGEFLRTLCEAAPLLEWRQTYTIEDVDAVFLQNYAWSEILGPRGYASAAPISCGVLILGPNTFYPEHRHEAEEFYVPLWGTAAWRQGDAVWRHRDPGTLIHHLREELHAMRTGETPLLAMYLWRSADLSQEARLERRDNA